MALLLKRFLIAEIALIGVVAAIFALIESKQKAGALTGTLFIALGFWIVGAAAIHPALRRTFTFGVGCVHLFAVSLPMVIVRQLNAGIDFRDLRIWGVPGPAFHGISSVVYLILICATAVDLFKNKKAR